MMLSFVYQAAQILGENDEKVKKITIKLFN